MRQPCMRFFISVLLMCTSVGFAQSTSETRALPLTAATMSAEEKAAVYCQRILNGQLLMITNEQQAAKDAAAEAKLQQQAAESLALLNSWGVTQSKTAADEFQTHRTKWDVLSLDNKRRAAMMCSAIYQVSSGDGKIEIVDALNGTAYARVSTNGDVWTNSFVASSKTAAEAKLDKLIRKH